MQTEDCVIYLLSSDSSFKPGRELIEELLTCVAEYDYCGARHRVSYNGLEAANPYDVEEFDIDEAQLKSLMKPMKHHNISLLGWDLDALLAGIASDILEISEDAKSPLPVSDLALIFGDTEIVDLADGRLHRPSIAFAFHCERPPAIPAADLVKLLRADQSLSDRVAQIEELFGSSVQLVLGAG